MRAHSRYAYRSWLAWVALLVIPTLTWAQISVIQPEPGARISGEVEVVARIGGSGVRAVHARIDGRPWVPMQRGDDGLWRTTLNTTLAPNGPTTISVLQWPVTEDGSASIAVTLENPLYWYWGDIHSHTSVSDGKMTPAEAYTFARDVARIDFFSLTDHLERVSPEEWGETMRAAWTANEDGRFVALTGLEWSKKVGHINVYDPVTYMWPTDLAEFYESAGRNCAVAKFNHPGWRGTNFNEFAYSPDGDAVIQLIEVRNDAEMQWYVRALDEGWHLAPDGSSDTHAPTWGDTRRWTVALAPGLSRLNIISALQQRHCYSTLDRNCRLLFWINGAVMGDVVEEPIVTAVVEVDVSDPDEGDVIKSIELFADGEVIATDEPGASQRRWKLTLSPEPGEHYYFVKVTQADNQAMWSAPIWITVPQH